MGLGPVNVATEAGVILMEEMSDKRMIFITVVSRGDNRNEMEVKQTWERALSEVLAPGIESLEKVTILPAPPLVRAPIKEDEQRPADLKTISGISLAVREEEKPPPKFYYTLDERQWWEIPGELTKVWQLRFVPKDLGITEGHIKVRGELGDRKVEGRVYIKSNQRHVLELAEP